ncbi:serine/threonine protein kinase [Mucilaginibacter limnophilus]|uniref:Serine/threonine protein kinase n=1 Tax=Mucilaginibacter limnophilus TaxID=1932778 RepID=A0A3S2XYD9_9SPHI|nr:serine/threonine-protein kinase [Mucilaginibacter limnophilus]RVT97358.1 serine/threonine protein kinase [Mucilaginibacter limnophilus]
MSKVFTIVEGLENLGALRTGGQGSVYKGKRTGTIYTAVKLIPTPLHTEDLEDRNYRNFQNEVAKLKKVNEDPSPNVVKILSSGITESGSFPFIEMEFIEGPDLGELLTHPHDKIFILKELVKVADQLACALAHCHKVGVKHGDIKSDNVKYNIHTGNYILLDFGLAIMTEEQRRTSIRHAGAVEFMAPEQNEGKMLMQTDVYSYGVVLFELLGGQVPYPLTGNSDTGRNMVMLCHMEDALPDVLELRRTNMPKTWNKEKKDQEMQVPAWLINLIAKCLQKKPEDRYANGIALHEAVVAGSISSVTGYSPGPEIAALQTENERLQQALAQQPQLSQIGEDIDKSKILVSKTAFNGIMVLMIIFMLLSGYLAFFKDRSAKIHVGNTDSIQNSADTTVVDSAPNPATYYKPPVTRDTAQQDSVIVKPETDTPAVTDSLEDLAPDTTVAPEP